VNTNLVAAGLLVSSSALWFTVHIALCWSLWPRLEGNALRWLVLLPPCAWLAPVWGIKYGLRARAITWLMCAFTYLGSFVAAA